MKTRVLMFTGGLDSVMLWRILGQPPCLFIAQPGSPYRTNEIDTILRLERLEPALHVSMAEGAEWPGPEPDGHVQHRNLGLIVQVAAISAAECIYLGSTRGESSPDKSQAFLRAAGRALSASEHDKIRVCAPLRGHTKAHHLQQHLAKWPDDAPLLTATRSCYGTDKTPCGECLACYRRWVAFKLAHLPIEEHATPPWERPWGGPRTALHYLAGTSPWEWRGMLDNHRDAVRALREQRA